MKRRAPPKHMLVIGLTGGIGMGKSTVAKILARQGFPVYDADKVVHGLLATGGKAVPAIAKHFPEAVTAAGINRKKLGRAVFGNPARLHQLEKIIHPLMRGAERAFVRRARASRAMAAVLEIPLLFETGADARCDLTFCVTAPRAVQQARVLARAGMTGAKLRAIRARQWPDKSKRAKADFVIPTGVSRADTTKHLNKILIQIGLTPSCH